jgi:cysteine protease ATG4
MSTLPSTQPKLGKLFSRTNANPPIASPSLSSTDDKTPSSSRSPLASATSKSKQVVRKTSKLFSPNESTTEDSQDRSDDESLFDTPVIVEPPQTVVDHGHSIARRQRLSDRPLSMATVNDVDYSGPSAPGRFSDFPSRLSGWFSHNFTASTTDLSPANTHTQPTLSPSPKHKASGLLSAARQSKNSFDRAMRYILDPDAHPDKTSEPIWLMGFSHSGQDPPSPDRLTISPGHSGHRRDSTDSSTLARDLNHRISYLFYNQFDQLGRSSR